MILYLFFESLYLGYEYDFSPSLGILTWVSPYDGGAKLGWPLIAICASVVLDTNKWKSPLGRVRIGIP